MGLLLIERKRKCVKRGGRCGAIDCVDLFALRNSLSFVFIATAKICVRGNEWIKHLQVWDDRYNVNNKIHWPVTNLRCVLYIIPHSWAYH